VIDDRTITFRFAIVLVLSIVCLAASAWADYQAGMDAYKNGDYATALRELRPLAEKGFIGAQFNLGQLYANGQGVPQDYVKARQWWEKAAVLGDVEAAANLGTLYLNGQGGIRDDQKALGWFRRSATHGDAMALTNLGLMYEHGNGVPQDVVLALKWYILGAGHGDKLGAERRDALAKRMTPAQIFQAQQRAREWKPRTP
jgi:uncharacterized protein